MSPAAGAGFFLQATGLDELAGFASELERDLRVGLKGRLTEAAQIVKREAEDRTHSKRVRAAMSFRVTVRSLIDFEARIGPLARKAFFAHFLEFGTIHSRAFPFLAPSMAATEDQIVDRVGFPAMLSGGGSR